MSFELIASGLAEDRDDQATLTLTPHLSPCPSTNPNPSPDHPNHPNRGDQAYAAALTYALVYETETPKRREQFTVPIYTRVTAVPVAARSVRGRLPSGAHCDNTSLATNSSGAVLVELGREASVPFSLCDLEGYPTAQPASIDPSKLVTSTLQRLGVPASPLRRAAPAVTFISGALYFVEVAPPALGSWRLSVFLGTEQLGPTVNVTAFCPAGQVPMPDGDHCGCAAGTVLKPGAEALLAAGVWEADENLCEACPGVLWSKTGADACSHCAADYYYVGPSVNGSASCAACPSFAACPPYTTLETLRLRSNMWRLTNRTLDARECATSGDLRRSPCVGGGQSGDETGSGYCAPGHTGPLCGVCKEENHFYDSDQMACVDCGDNLFWLYPLLRYLLPLLAIGIVIGASTLLIEHAPERLHFLSKRLVKMRLLAVDANVYTRIKLLVGFYQVCSALPKVYGVRLPDEYRRYFGWAAWVGQISLDLILPVGCDRPLKPYERLVVEGLVPVLLILLAVALSVGRGVALHVWGEDAQLSGVARKKPWRKAMAVSVLRQLGGSLPWLLPFSYLCSTSIATQAFNAFDCAVFEVDETLGPEMTVSYLASDLRVLCDASDADYRMLLTTASILIGCVSVLPLIYFVLVFKSRHAIRNHSPTRLSRGCRFLWAEYKEGFWYFETVQQLRRLFLTGYVLLLSDRPNTRLLAASCLTFAFREYSDYLDPYRDPIGGRLHALQSLLLIVVFLTGVLVRLCDDPEYGAQLCPSFGFESAFGVSSIFLLMNFGNCVVLLSLICMKAFTQSKATTLRLKSGSEPAVTLASEHKYHTFISHIWSTGQDQAAVIKRQICLLLPTAKVFLDVDDLVEIGNPNPNPNPNPNSNPNPNPNPNSNPDPDQVTWRSTCAAPRACCSSSPRATSGAPTACASSAPRSASSGHSCWCMRPTRARADCPSRPPRPSALSRCASTSSCTRRRPPRQAAAPSPSPSRGRWWPGTASRTSSCSRSGSSAARYCTPRPTTSTSRSRR